MRILGWLLLIFAGLTFWMPLIGMLSFPAGLIGALLLVAAAINGKNKREREEEEIQTPGVSNSMFGR